MSMNISNDIIGNGTHDIPVCIAVPQPTVAPRAPLQIKPTKNNPTSAVPNTRKLAEIFVMQHVMLGDFLFQFYMENIKNMGNMCTCVTAHISHNRFLCLFTGYNT